MTKKILLVGFGNHQFITNYVHWLRKKSPSYTIDILSEELIEEKYQNLYDEIYSVYDSFLFRTIISKIKGLRRIFRFLFYLKFLQKISSYDFVHFHYVSYDSYFLSKKINSKGLSKIILSVWGSDMYRLGDNYFDKFSETCEYAHKITFSNEESIKFFRDKTKWKKNNLKLCRFGLAPLEVLRKNDDTRVSAKIKMGFNPKKLTIVIGYNAFEAQQHLEILKQFENVVMNKYINKIQLVLPLTYGGSKDYKNEILEKLIKLPFEYYIYNDFLTDKEVSLLRRSSDLMIQLQVTDQFSGSMQEHLFTNNVVITGSWLPYNTLKTNGVNFLEIDHIKQLNELLPQVLSNFEKYLKQTVNNPKVIERLSSWNNNINNWLKLYES